MGGTVEALIKKLNKMAAIYWTEQGVIEMDKIIGTGHFDMQTAQKSAGWMHELAQPHHTPETEEYGISSLVFRADRPFHPKRLYDILNGFGKLDRENIKKSGLKN